MRYVSRKSLLYLSDILEAVTKIRSYTKGLSQTDFETNDLILDACYHNFLVIGEAVKQLPDALLAAYPSVPWREIKGMRDYVAHEYFRVDNRILWDVIQYHLAALELAATELLTTEAD